MREERQSTVVALMETSCRRTVIRNQKTTQRSKKLKLRTVAVYGGVFLFVITFLALSYQTGGVATQQGVASASQPVSRQDDTTKITKVSVDQLAATNAAANLAEATNLPAAGDLREATTTLSVKKELSQGDVEIISKPQIVQPEKTVQRGVVSYVTKQGDTIESIAKSFKISAQTLRWANNMNSDAVEPGRSLIVPRINGVVYTVKDGDTVQLLAQRYKSNVERILLYNGLNAGANLQAGIRLVLPDGVLPEEEQPGYVARRPTPSYAYNSRGYQRRQISSSYARASVGNRYASGNCTWYVYERRLALGRPIGSFWGNANTWSASARAAGYIVNRIPAPGAIFQSAAGGGGYGHVGIVERVEGGRVFVSDMNFAGYGVVTHRELPNPGSYNYIH